MDSQLSKEQEESRQQEIAVGEVLSIMVNSEGWKLIKSYFENKIRTFSTMVLLEEDRNIEEFEKERRELMGLRKLLGYVDEHIKLYHDERNKKVK